MIYQDKIKAGIGKAKISVKTDNTFPVIGDKVTLSSYTKWSQNIKFETNSGSTVSTVEKPNATQTESAEIYISAPGDLIQTVTASNSISTAQVKQLVMAMQFHTEPYYGIKVDKEIVRTGEEIEFFITYENGYLLSREFNVEIKVYNENMTGTPVGTISYGKLASSEFSRIPAGKLTFDKRGIYDVHVSVTDVESGVTISKQHNKLITVTPRLAARPTQQQISNGEYTEIVADAKYGISLKMYETGANDLYCVFDLKSGQAITGYYAALDISKIPFGKDAYTFVLKGDESAGKYFSRILLTGATNINTGNANGTPQFSYDIPLVFTIDRETPLTIWGVHYSAVNYSGCIRNTVWDGRGYYDIQKGIKFDRYSADMFWQDAMMLLNGTSDVELFEIEICNTGFTAISSKTDPTSKNPLFWYGNFEERNFILHHSYIHDTAGEGFYIGYFTASAGKTTYTGETITFKNLAGENVTYIKGGEYTKRAHNMEKVRIYRNRLERLGYDGMQLSNARNSEVCYNEIDFGGVRNEQSQMSGISLQSMDGRIYNNTVTNHNGPGMQLGPMTNLEVFNNIVNTDQETDAIQFLFELENPDMNPTGGGSGVINNTTVVNVHNNVLVAGRFTANGRNTVQMRSVYFTDNLMVNNGKNFANMTNETLQVWNDNMQGNSVYAMPEFLTKLQELKIADRDNSDFRIGNNSPLAQSGTGLYFGFDFRGYKNWYSNIYPAGAYMGIYRNPDFYMDPLEIIAFTANNGTTQTVDRTVAIVFSYAGAAIKYRLSEDPGFAGAGWENVPDDNSVQYILSSGYGVKTIYLQLANASETSEAASVNIEYVDVPLVLTGVVVNGGDSTVYDNTVGIELTYTGNTPPTHYRAGETNDPFTAEWIEYTDAFQFKLSEGYGDKTVYVQIKNADEVSAVISGTVTYAERITGNKIVVSFGNISDDLQAKDLSNKYENGIEIIGFLAKGATRDIRDSNGNITGSVCSPGADIKHQVPSYISPGITVPAGLTLPAVSSFMQNGFSNNVEGSMVVNVVVPPGTYDISLFASIHYLRPCTPNVSYSIITNGGEPGEAVTPLVFTGIDDNTDEWMSARVVVPESGFSIQAHRTAYNAYTIMPLNMMILEKVPE